MQKQGIIAYITGAFVLAGLLCPCPGQGIEQPEDVKKLYSYRSSINLFSGFMLELYSFRKNLSDTLKTEFEEEELDALYYQFLGSEKIALRGLVLFNRYGKPLFSRFVGNTSNYRPFSDWVAARKQIEATNKMLLRESKNSLTQATLYYSLLPIKFKQVDADGKEQEKVYYFSVAFEPEDTFRKLMSKERIYALENILLCSSSGKILYSVWEHPLGEAGLGTRDSLSMYSSLKHLQEQIAANDFGQSFFRGINKDPLELNNYKVDWYRSPVFLGDAWTIIHLEEKPYLEEGEENFLSGIWEEINPSKTHKTQLAILHEGPSWQLYWPIKNHPIHVEGKLLEVDLESYRIDQPQNTTSLTNLKAKYNQAKNELELSLYWERRRMMKVMKHRFKKKKE